MEPLALYIHWPFCLQKCPYCDFNSHVRERIPQARFGRALRAELAWASLLLLNNTATKAIVIHYQDKVILRRGILGQNAQLTPGAIIKRVLETQKAVYLVALKLYPGRIEFDYLPENTQGVICQPIDAQGVIVLGANAPRSYTQQDEAWIAAIADKLSYSLSRELGIKN